jgi:hypothetical protein
MNRASKSTVISRLMLVTNFTALGSRGVAGTLSLRARCLWPKGMPGSWRTFPASGRHEQAKLGSSGWTSTVEVRAGVDGSFIGRFLGFRHRGVSERRWSHRVLTCRHNVCTRSGQKCGFLKCGFLISSVRMWYHRWSSRDGR